MLLFEESAQFWTWKVIHKQIRHIWAVLIQHLEQKYNGSLDQSKTLHIHCCQCGQHLNCTWAGIIHYVLSPAFQRWYKKKTFFGGGFIFYHIYCVIFSHIPFTFPQTSKCFLSNGTTNMHIFASGPELQAVRFGYVILGENVKKNICQILNLKYCI